MSLGYPNQEKLSFCTSDTCTGHPIMALQRNNAVAVFKNTSSHVRHGQELTSYIASAMRPERLTGLLVVLKQLDS